METEPVLIFEGFGADTLPAYRAMTSGTIQGVNIGAGRRLEAIGVGFSGYRFNLEGSKSLNKHNIPGEALARMTGVPTERNADI